MAERKAVIKNADMSEDMQQDAVDCASQALEKYNIEKDIAAYIKKEFDKKYNPTWHWCVYSKKALCLSPSIPAYTHTHTQTNTRTLSKQHLIFNLHQHCWQEFRLIRDARDKALHILLLGPSGCTFIQVWLNCLFSCVCVWYNFCLP